MSRRWVRVLSWMAIIGGSGGFLNDLMKGTHTPFSIVWAALLVGLGTFFLIRTKTP
jgi:hypothetical protein